MSNEASVKLTLKGDGFKRGMSETEAAAKKSAQSIGGALKSSLSEAGKAGLDALKTSLGKLKDVATGFLGVAGGLGVAELARKAMENEGAFRKMAAAIKFGSGQLVNWRDLQKEAQATALKTGHTTGEVAESMKRLRDVTGDTTFARKASDVVAQVATGSHESLSSITELAAGLNEKFGVTHEQLGDTLASVIQLGDSGGVTVEELAENINRMGAGAKQAGLDGQKGFETMVEWLHVAHGATGNLRKGITGVSGIIDAMASGSIKQPLLAHFQYDLDAAKKSGKDFNTILGDIIKKSGGKQEKLAQVFSGDQLKVVAELGKTYQKAFSGTTGDIKAKTDAGMAAYNAALHDTAKGTTSFKDLQEEAAKEMETPEKKIATSLEKLAQAFASEKMMGAFNKLADFMPKVVDAITAHPLLTGAAMTGIPQAVAGAVLQGLMSGLMKGGGGGGGAGAAGPIAAAAVATYLIGREKIDEHFAAKSATENRAIGQGFEARNALSVMRMGASTGNMTAEQQHANREAIRASLKTMNERIADAQFAEGGAAFMSADARAGANERYKSGTAFQGSKVEVDSLVQQRADLEEALKIGFKGPSAAARGRLMSGTGTDADVAAFNDVISEGAGGLLTGNAGPHGKKRHTVFNPLSGETVDLDAQKAAAKATAQVDPATAQAHALADAIAGRELKVTVINAQEIGAAASKSGGPAPGILPR